MASVPSRSSPPSFTSVMAAERQEARGPGADGAHQSGQGGTHAGLAVRERVQGHASMRPDLVGQGLHGLGSRDDGVVLDHRFGGRRVFGYQGAKPERGEERVATLA